MKFYYNGQLVRTSDHNYTHAVINEETGAVVGCRTSEKAAQALKASEISGSKTGIENAMRHLKAIEDGKASYLIKVGNRSYYGSVHASDSAESTRAWIENAKERVERIEKNWKVVELEVR